MMPDTIRLSELAHDPYLKAIFRRAERDVGGMMAMAGPEPKLPLPRPESPNPPSNGKDVPVPAQPRTPAREACHV